MSNEIEARKALDKLIDDAHIHAYKPIQLAELLKHARLWENIDFDNVKSYQKRSQKWRDAKTLEMFGRVCKSSSPYQDNLFTENEMPPRYLKALHEQNKNGKIEKYIYDRIREKIEPLYKINDYCFNATPETFSITNVLNLFNDEPSLRRSIDKIYEIATYALYFTIINNLGITVQLSLDNADPELRRDFKDLVQIVMGVDLDKPQPAKIYRVGVTNAADKGIDMGTNWGTTIQVKHGKLTPKLAKSVISQLDNDRIHIVTKEADVDKIRQELHDQNNKLQSIATERFLVEWYGRVFKEPYAQSLGPGLLQLLRKELLREFPQLLSLSY